jgi:hypothetical protein
MVAPGIVSPQDIDMSPMVCRLQELDGANVHHGLGGDYPHSSAIPCTIVMVKETQFHNHNHPSAKIPRGNM